MFLFNQILKCVFVLSKKLLELKKSESIKIKINKRITNKYQIKNEIIKTNLF